MLKSGRHLLMVLLLAGACALDPASAAEPPKPSPAGLRITALVRAVRFQVPGAPARVTLTPGSSALVFPGNQAETPRVLVEEGGALLEVAPNAPSIVRLMGALHGLHVKSGRAVYLRRGFAGEESGLVVDGVAEVPTGSTSVPFPKDQLLRATPAGSVLIGIDPAVAEMAKAMAALGVAKDATVVDLPPAAFPAPVGKLAVVSSATLSVVPLAGGTSAAALAQDRPAVGNEPVSSYRQRLLVGTREDGLGGAGFWLDFVPARAGRVRNLISAGARGFVRFFYTPRWLVTLAPGAVAECDAPEAPGSDAKPATLRLLRGAMMVQGRDGTLPEWLSLSDLASEAPTPEGGLPGTREIITAVRAPHEAQVPTELLIARAREALRPILSLNLGTNLLVPPAAAGAAPLAAGALPRGVVPVIAFTVMADLPVSPDSIRRAAGIHVASTVPQERVTFSMFGAAPQPEKAIGALVQVPGAGEAFDAVAVVLPRSLPEQAGPDPKPFTTYVSAQKLDLWTVRRQAEEAMKPPPEKPRTAPASRPTGGGGGGGGGRSWMLGLAALALLAIPGVRSRVLSLFEGGGGTGGSTRCPECEGGVQNFPLGTFVVDEDPLPILELLKYDSVREMGMQHRARAAILETVKKSEPIAREKPRFEITGHWCLACASGTIVSEVVRDGSPIDEAVWRVENTDTYNLMRMIKNPKLIPELTKRDE